MPDTNDPCIGIDLGTTYSAVAWLNAAGEPTLLSNAEGSRLTASAVMRDVENDAFVVGSPALDQRGAYPDRVAAEFKRQMDKPDWRAQLGDRQLSAVELSAMVLRKLKQDAEKALQTTVTDAVITVPAYFDHPRRVATIEAARIAGLNAKEIVNEPDAASLVFARGGGKPGLYVVFDLGGGTFDVTVAEIVSDKEVKARAIEGDARLGGMDFDWLLALEACDEYRRMTGLDLIEGMGVVPKKDRLKREKILGLEPGTAPMVNRGQAFKLLAQVEQLKRLLGSTEKQTLGVGQGANIVQLPLTRARFEELLAPWVERTELRLDAALSQAQLSPAQVDGVILVGGSTRIPAFQRMLERKFGRKPNTPVHQDEAVALGAAVRHGLLKGRLSGRLQRVSSRAFGTLVLDWAGGGDPPPGTPSVNSVIIPKGTPLPARKTDTVLTVLPNQTSVACSVTEATDNDVRDPAWVTVRWNGSLAFGGPKPRDTPIDITFSFDENQVMHCSFTERESGRAEVVDLNLAPKKPEGENDGDDDFLDLDDLEIV